MKTLSVLMISIGFFYAGTLHFTDAHDLVAITLTVRLRNCVVNRHYGIYFSCFFIMA